MGCKERVHFPQNPPLESPRPLHRFGSCWGFKGASRHSATVPLGIVYFYLTPQVHRRRIPATFRLAYGRGDRIRAYRAMSENDARQSMRGKACSICLVGLCNASIRSARLAAIGCAQALPEGNSAATVARRSIMFRLRSARACGCVPAHLAATVLKDARQDVRGSRQQRAPLGPARPDAIGASRPRKLPPLVPQAFSLAAFMSPAQKSKAYRLFYFNHSLAKVCIRHEKGGERPVGVPAARGHGTNSQRLHSGQNYRNRLGGNRSHSIAPTTGSFCPEPSAASMRRWLHSHWYSCTGPANRYPPRSGMFSRASLKRLVKFATQMTSVSSTICPSS